MVLEHTGASANPVRRSTQPLRTCNAVMGLERFDKDILEPLIYPMMLETTGSGRFVRTYL